MNYTKEQTEEAKQKLKMILEAVKKQGGERVIWQSVNGVARSGMSRTISNYVILDNEPRWIDWQVARVLELPLDKNDKGVKVRGCGMDMGFSIAYDLGRVLYPKGDGKTVTGRNGEKGPETDGGYLIKQRWL